MIEAFRRCGVDVVPIGPLSRPLRHEVARYAYRALGRGRYLPEREPTVLDAYARQIESQASGSDVLFSHGSVLLTRVRTDRPIVFWADATFARIVDYYPEYSRLSRRSRLAAHAQEQEAIDRAALCIYSSEWAAASAINTYGADPSKVRVIPFGANIPDPGSDTVRSAINDRSLDQIELVLVQRDWKRKGGDFAVEVARELGARLTVVGDAPPTTAPDHVTYRGHLRKSVEGEREELARILLNAHFLVLPTYADCTPLVFCEASAYGVPSVSFNTGGVSGLVDQRNGLLLPPLATPAEMAHAIRQILPNYRELALSTRTAYQTRLNWDVVTRDFVNAVTALTPSPVDVT